MVIPNTRETAEATPTTSKGSRLAIVVVIFVLTILGFCLHRQMNRPLEQDELVTLKKYTGVDYSDTSEGIRSLHRFNVVRLAKGLSKCFVNGWDPNNHIANSLSISVSHFIFGFSEKAFRIPALIGSILFSIAIFYWIFRTTGSLWLGIVSALLLISHPYFIYYGQSARGYSITAFLVVIQVMAIDRMRSARQTSLWETGLLALLSIVLFLNLVSMLVFWLVPVLLIGCLIISGRTPAKFSEWKNWLCEPKRQAWLFQGAIVGLASFLFITGHLHDFLVSQSKYGIVLASRGQIVPVIVGLGHYLLPNGWLIVGILGAIGLLLMLFPKNFHWLSVVAIGSFLFTVVYAVGTRKFPYERTFGFWLVLLVMGIAGLWNATRTLATRSRQVIQMMIILVLLGVTTISGVSSVRSGPGVQVPYSEMATAIRDDIASRHLTAHEAHVCLPWVWGEEMQFYLPADSSYFSIESKDVSSVMNVYFPCIEEHGKYLFRTQWADRSKQEMVYWPIPESWHPTRAFPSSQAAVFRVSCRVARDFDASLSNGPTIVVWNQAPYFGLPHYVADNLKKGASPWTLSLNTIDYLSTTSLTMFASNASELEQAKAIIADLRSKTSGELFVLQPTSDNASQQ